jgi:hypothetical protein
MVANTARHHKMAVSAENPTHKRQIEHKNTTFGSFFIINQKPP